MSAPQPSSQVAESADQYMLPRDYAGSARINLQHYLMRDCIGYLLHPSIPITSTMKIADVATGTGMWLLDLSQRVPESVQLCGFDISSDQFPPASSLPPNIGFSTFDAAKGIPAELIGQFDVVHVRFLISVIDGNFQDWLADMLKLLKPGGWLQWNEGDFPGYIQAAHDHTKDAGKYPGFAALDQLTVQHSGKRLATKRWVTELKQEFEKGGLEEVQYKRFEPPARLGRALSENALLAIEETARKAGKPEMLEVTRLCGEDLKNGAVRPGLAPVVAVGRKPL